MNTEYKKAIDLTRELVKFNSYELEGKLQCIKYVEKYLKENTDADINSYDMDTEDPYLVAQLKIKNPKFKLMLQGHLDVVSPEGMKEPFSARVEDGYMHGRGTSDMKSGCASIITAFVEASRMENQTGDLILAFSTDEEYKADQMTSAIAIGNIPKPDLCIIAEPTAENFAVSHKGNAWMKVEFSGKTAHASTPKLGINAIHRAGRFTAKLEKYLEIQDETLEETKFGKPTMNIGTIQGGSKPNVVPSSCTLMIDKRYLPSENVDIFIKEIEDIIEECRKEDSEFEAVTTLIGDWSALSLDTDKEAFKRIKKAVEQANKKEVVVADLGGWGEGGYLQKLGIDTMYYGPGNFGEAHTPTEKLFIEELISVCNGMNAIVQELCFKE